MEHFFENTKNYNSSLESAKKIGCHTVHEAIVKLYCEDGLPANKIAIQLSSIPITLVTSFIKFQKLKKANGNIKPSDSYDVIDRKLFSSKVVEEKEPLLQEIGYKHISEAIVDMYFNKKCIMSDIANILQVASSFVAKTIKKMNLTPRKKGGKTYEKLTEEMKEEIEKDFKVIEPNWSNIRNYCLEKNISLSPRTIQRFLAKLEFMKN